MTETSATGGLAGFTPHPFPDKNGKPLAYFRPLTAPEGKAIMCVGPFCWGKGATGDIAYRNARSHLPGHLRSDYRPKFLFYVVPASTYVDDWGSLCYPSDGEAPALLGFYLSRPTSR